MNSWLMGFIAVVYSIVAFNFFKGSQLGFGIAFIGYTIGNIGLILAALGI